VKLTTAAHQLDFNVIDFSGPEKAVGFREDDATTIRDLDAIDYTARGSGRCWLVSFDI